MESTVTEAVVRANHRVGHAWLRAALGDFERTSALEKLGELAAGAAGTRFAAQRLDQVRAWEAELRLLGHAVQKLLRMEPASASWSLLLEYEIPRRQKRIDAVLLSRNVIVVIEFKIGAKAFHRADIWQLEDYLLDLRDFHERSQGYPMAGILVASDAPLELCGMDLRGSLAIVGANADGLAHAMLASVLEPRRDELPALDPATWDASGYRPAPSIVEATQRLFAGHSVRDISHAYADNLTATVDAVSAEIRAARATQARVVCFITGVPGAGKTLAGLAAVHDPIVAGGTEGDAAFMSGNGPLVRVLREALVRNGVAGKELRRDVERRAELMIQNVHQFVYEHGVDHPDIVPYGHVIVFDEAQRAWHAQKLNRRHRTVNHSEPAIVLQVMARIPDWSVVVALIGGGQEIHDGEAGLEEWGRALADSPVPWRVVVSPEVVYGGASVAHHRLFENPPPDHLRIESLGSMHLSVNVRSPRAQRIAEWVNAVLEMDISAARRAIEGLKGFRIGLTRDLAAARSWLRDAARGDHRCGLLSSSGNLRLRAYGLEILPAFLDAVSVERWFLDPPEDLRSSFWLEVAMTEFKCQGLELDFVGLCWGDDLTVDQSIRTWDMRILRGSRWKPLSNETKRRYLLNKYRVLLTRAREGLVIWVPPGDDGDPTRERSRLDRTAELLSHCGVPLLSRV